jgi:hypothetical protein
MYHLLLAALSLAGVFNASIAMSTYDGGRSLARYYYVWEKPIM